MSLGGFWSWNSTKICDVVKNPDFWSDPGCRKCIESSSIPGAVGRVSVSVDIFWPEHGIMRSSVTLYCHSGVTLGLATDIKITRHV